MFHPKTPISLLYACSQLIGKLALCLIKYHQTTLVLRIGEVPGSNLGAKTGHHDCGFCGFAYSIQTRVSLIITISIIIVALQPFVGPWPLFQYIDPIHSR
jgi:hypothetical protein